MAIESGHPVELTKEENYMFRLKSFESELKKYVYDENVVVPNIYAEQLRWQLNDLEDLSVSRESRRVSWGIQVCD